MPARAADMRAGSWFLFVNLSIPRLDDDQVSYRGIGKCLVQHDNWKSEPRVLLPVPAVWALLLATGSCMFDACRATTTPQSAAAKTRPYSPQSRVTKKGEQKAWHLPFSSTMLSDQEGQLYVKGMNANWDQACQSGYPYITAARP